MNDISNWKEIEQRIAAAVKLPRRPVAVSFLDSAPANVQKFSGSEPSGCSYWRLAAEGRVFYTVPEDHFNCAVGAYTHNISLSPEREKETQQTLKMMFELNYVKPCKPSAAMLLNEAANRAGIASGAPALGRPTCMALPASLQHGAILSLGCMGNRVYTGLSEDEMYFVLRGKDLVAVADSLA